ncbi:hypothetical protein QTP88_015039 [Uroleucon formosanum]
MSVIDQNETSSSENLIDLEGSVSVPSSGELYEPSGEFDSNDSRSDFKLSNNYGGKTNSVQKSNSKPPGACFRCGRTNHQAKQCRASEADQARYKESQNKSKTETKAIRIVTCNYCKKPNYTISECRKRKYVNERKAQEQQGTSSGNEQTPGPSGARPCLTNSVKLLIDTGSDLNMIKLSILRNEVMVDETQSYQLKGINEYLVHTLGSVILNLNLGTETLTTKFQVVHDDFPIPHEGILGNPFLAENRIAIDYYSSKIFQNNTDPLTLSPRSKTIVPIASTRPEGTALVVHSQILQEENIRLGNVVNTVKQGKILAIAIYTSEELITIPLLNLEEIEFEEFRETSMLIATNTKEITEDTHRIGRIQEAILYQELNAEESNNIFQLEGDSFPSIDAIQHEIHLKEGAKPVNVRPYRLPYAHRQEIVRQMEELESNNIIQSSESPWNAPLIMVSKKPDIHGNPKYRVCVDFRRLNELTIEDAYPIPRIDEILDQLGLSRYYTTLDLVSGYHQVSIKAEDRQKTAFSTDKGHYEFWRMPFGLSEAPRVKPDPGKIQCVQNHPVPSNTTVIKQFFGLSGYYRRFIEGYSQTAKPLTALLNKDVLFEWSTECQRAFEMLKQKLVEAPVLQYTDFKRPFILTTDASQFAIGNILSQGTPGQDRSIAYPSRTLNKAEQAYSTTEKELLSIVWAVKNFRLYLLGRQFKIYTDHRPLTWLFNVKDPGSRLLRWRLKLAEYQFEVIYKTGKSNTNADALSRIMEVKVVQTRSQQHSAGSLINLKLFHERIPFTALRVAYFQLGSRYIINLVTKDKCWQKPTLEDMYISLRNLRLFCQEFEIKNLAMPKIGCGLDQLDWPTELRMIKYIFQDSEINIQIFSKQSVTKLDKQQIISEHHLAVLGGHRGVNQTVKRIQKQFDWEGLSQDIAEFINKCSSCQMNKTSSLGPLTRTYQGNVYILTLQCDLTKFSVATPMANKEANTVAYHFVISFVCIHGIPQNLISDQGTEFLNKIFSETYADQQNWDTYIPYAMFTYNSSEHQSTGKQPYAFLYGRTLKRLREAHRIARERLMKNKIKTKASYEQTSNPITIHVNNRVLIQDKTRKATVPLDVQAESITQLPESLISLNTFSDHTGMYYEFREHIKLANTDGNLITFVDLSNFNSKFQLLRSTYKATAEICTDLQYKVNVTEFWHPCK